MTTESLAMTVEHLAYYETALQEGGWYAGDQARDTHPTMQGVTQETYAAHGFAGSVHTMTEAERATIYRSYWVDAACDLFGPLSAPLVFDHSFNAGAGAARRVVQRALGLHDDGKFGPVTLAAIAAAQDRELAYRLVLERLIAYDEISDSPRLRPNLKAWVGRLADYARKHLRA